MNELINKTEVIEDLKKDIAESDNWLIIAIYLAITVRIMSYKNIDAVEVVRCGECKWLNPKGRCQVFADPYIRPSTSDYCSYGERREDAEIH